MYELRIIPSNECNFSCQYCSLNYKDKNRLSFESFVSNTVKLLDILAKDEDIILTFSGGEPFKYSKLLEFITQINEKTNRIKKIKFISNGYYTKRIKKIIEFALSNNIEIKILYSYHAFYENYDIKNFLDRINVLPHEIEVFFMLENNIKKIFENYKFVKEHCDLDIRFLEVQGEDNYQTYLELFKNDVFFNNRIWNTNPKKSKSFFLKCNAIADNICFDYMGNIRPSKKCNDFRIFGNIKDDDIFERLDKIKKKGFYYCINPICSCQYKPKIKNI